MVKKSVSAGGGVSNKCEIGVHAHYCSALVAGGCKNGFPVTMGCMTMHSVVPLYDKQWWTPGSVIPHCMDEDYVLEPPEQAQ